MSLCETSSRRLARGEFGVAGPSHYCGPDRLLAFFGNSGGAEIQYAFARGCQERLSTEQPDKS